MLNRLRAGFLNTKPLLELSETYLQTWPIRGGRELKLESELQSLTLKGRSKAESLGRDRTGFRLWIY